MYQNEESIPAQLLRPASTFQSVRRLGQYSTFVRVETDEGLTGLGEAYGLPHPSVTADVISHVLTPELIGRDERAAKVMLKDFRTYFQAMGHTRGSMLEALSAVDIALWDLQAKVQEVPLWELLGGQPGNIAAYASPVPFHQEPEDSREAALAFIESGYRNVKLKIGRGIKSDLAHLEAVRDGIGPQVGLMVDANCAYDVSTAIRLSCELARFDIMWLEEPIPPDNPQELAEVRRSSPVAIACGENEFSAHGIKALIKEGAVDILQPNVTRAGGITGCLEIANLCAKHRLKFAPHGVGGGVGVAAMLHTCASSPSLLVCEANRLPNPLRDELVHPHFESMDGAFILPKGYGLGVEVDWGLAEQYSMERNYTHGV